MYWKKEASKQKTNKKRKQNEKEIHETFCAN